MTNEEHADWTADWQAAFQSALQAALQALPSQADNATQSQMRDAINDMPHTERERAWDIYRKLNAMVLADDLAALLAFCLFSAELQEKSGVN